VTGTLNRRVEYKDLSLSLLFDTTSYIEDLRIFPNLQSIGGVIDQANKNFLLWRRMSPNLQNYVKKNTNTFDRR